MFKWNMSSVYTRGGVGEQHEKKGGGVYIMIIRGYSDLNIQYISQPVTSKYNTTNK